MFVVRRKMASVAQSVERWSRDPGSRVQFPAGDLGVAFFETGPGCVLKSKHQSVDNEFECQILSLIKLVHNSRQSKFRSSRKIPPTANQIPLTANQALHDHSQ